MFCKKRCFKSFAKFTGKQLCQSLFFNRIAGISPVIFFKKETLAQVFSCEFWEERPWTTGSKDLFCELLTYLNASDFLFKKDVNQGAHWCTICKLGTLSINIAKFFRTAFNLSVSSLQFWIMLTLLKMAKQLPTTMEKAKTKSFRCFLKTSSSRNFRKVPANFEYDIRVGFYFLKTDKLHHVAFH